MTDPMQLPLKDIHLPQEIIWWPPAPGWWVMLGLFIFILATAYWWHRRRQRILRSAINLARQELVSLQGEYDVHQDARQFIADLSILLRRLSISAFPRRSAASLTGEAWLQFLDAPLQQPAFTKGPGRILIEAPYRPEVRSVELQPLIAVCRQWIEKLADKKEGQRT